MSHDSAPPVLTVGELTQNVKFLIQRHFSSVAVQGELSSSKLHSSGHFYFILKDARAQINGVMWRSRVPVAGKLPADGTSVVVTGRLTVYEPRGQYQIEASTIRPLGIGDLQAQFDELKKKLDTEGLFKIERKRSLPTFPTTLGVVTSRSGAAYQDILKVLRHRYPVVRVVLRPAQVQGKGAAEDIAAGIRDLNELGGVDLIIVGRGGGSAEDLWAFNEEPVARAIAKSQVPVISAVGHEVDISIADLVADVRGATPTHAAQLAVPDRVNLLENIRRIAYTLHDILDRAQRTRRNAIRNLLQSYAFNRPLDVLRQHSQRIDELERSVTVATTHRFTLAQSRLTAVRSRLAALDSISVLKRGYAIVTKGGVPVRSAQSLGPDDPVKLRFHDGSLDATIDR